MIPGLMMDRPLLISSLIDYAAELHPRGEIVSVLVEGGVHRYDYAGAAKRIAQLANALVDMGVKSGDRVATLAWNGHRHLELYYAVSGIGAVCHTINPRLPPDQLVYILNHAADVALFFDTTFAPLVARLRPFCPASMLLVAMTDAAHLPDGEGLERVLAYENLLVGQARSIVWPEFDENAAAALCYTSGTTGDPKGALYSHRSQVLHALFTGNSAMRCWRDPARKILPVVPLFHVNAWGLPYIAPLRGNALAFPGPRLDGASLFEFMDAEEVYSAWGVPTVWMGLLAEIRKRGRKPAGFEEVIIGGSAAPRAMIEAFERELDVAVVHGWGMTEMSPVGTFGVLEPEMETLPLDEIVGLKEYQGRRLFGVDLKIVDEAGVRLPHDGEAVGELFVRGPAVISGYYGNPEASAGAFDAEGWFDTGDVARITPDGFLQIVDRSKDLIKSGGEWISSIDLENLAIGVAGVANAAVIAVPDEKWTERPLLIVVRAQGSEVTKEAILEAMAARIAKWQVPNEVVFVESLPLGATGKVSKRQLRERFGSGVPSP